MKQLIIIFFCLTITTILDAQSLSKNAAIKACKCIDSLKTNKNFEDSIKECAAKGLVLAYRESSQEDKERLNYVSEMVSTLGSIYKTLPLICYKVRKFVNTSEQKKYYSQSPNSVANQHYDFGIQKLKNEDYQNAIDEFQKAIKSDKNFVNAFDNLALTYRKLKEYKKSIKFYKKSLKIFPEGDVALLNIAQVYSLLNDSENAINYYEKFIYNYQDDPEGYFGLAKIQFLKGNYESALDNLFTANRIYINTNSVYKKDCEQFIQIMFLKMKDLNKVDLFKSKAKLYNVGKN